MKKRRSMTKHQTYSG